MSITLNLLVLKSRDLEALRSFYEVLGFAFTREQHGQGPEHFSPPVGETLLELYPLPADVAPDVTARLGFSITDVDAALAAIESTRGQVIKPGRETPRGYVALVKDPDGRTVELTRK